MRAVFSLAVKDLRLLRRDKVAFFFIFGFPLTFALFFGLVFGRGGGVMSKFDILIVDEDNSVESNALVEALRGSDEVRPLASDLQSARAAVLRGKYAAFVVIPEGFGRASRRPFWGETPTFVLGIDPSRKAESGLLQGVLTKYVAQDMFKVFSDPDLLRERSRQWVVEVQQAPQLTPLQKTLFSTFFTALDQLISSIPPSGTADEQSGNEASSAVKATGGRWQPINVTVTEMRRNRRISDDPNTSMDVTFPQALVWGLMGCSATFGISLVQERTRGTLVRLRLSPLHRWHILAGKGLACFFMVVLVSLVLLAFAMIAFDVRPENYPHLALAMVSAAVCFTGIMMMLAVIGRTESSAGGIGWSVLTIMAMLGGGMIPYFLMPDWMKTLASISPVKWTIVAMEGAIFRGFTLEQMAWPCGILVAIGAACLIVGSRVFAWTD